MVIICITLILYNRLWRAYHRSWILQYRSGHWLEGKRDRFISYSWAAEGYCSQV